MRGSYSQPRFARIAFIVGTFAWGVFIYGASGSAHSASGFKKQTLNNSSFSNSDRTLVTHFYPESQLRKTKARYRDGSIESHIANNGYQAVRYLVPNKTEGISFLFEGSGPSLSLKSIVIQNIIHQYGDGIDEGSFDEPCADPKSLVTQSSAVIHAAGTVESEVERPGPKISGECGRPEADVRKMLSEIPTQKRLDCLKGFKTYGSSSSTLLDYFKASTELEYVCSLEKRSSFLDQSPPQVTLGSDILNSTDPTRLLFHELLHATGVSRNSEVNSIVGCCVDGEREQCKRVADYDGTHDLRKYPGLDEYIGELIQNDKVPSSDKAAFLDKLKAKQLELFRCGSKDPDGPRKFEQFAARECSRHKFNTCKQLQSALGSKRQIDEHCVFPGSGSNTVRKSTVERVIGSAKAEPALGADVQGPVTPTELKVTSPATSTRDPAVRRDLARHERFLDVARSQAREVASAVMGGAGNAAYAVVPRLPKAPADGSTVAVPSRIEGDKQWFQTGDVEFSASIPRFGDEGGKPTIEFRDTKTGRRLVAPSVSRATLSAASEGASSPEVITPTRSRDRSRGKEATVSSETQSAAGSLASGGRVGQASATATPIGISSRGPSASPAPTAFRSGDQDTPAKRAEVRRSLKDQFVRSSEPLNAIKDRMADIQSSGLRVYLDGEAYPPKSAGPAEEDYDLDKWRRLYRERRR